MIVVLVTARVCAICKKLLEAFPIVAKEYKIQSQNQATSKTPVFFGIVYYEGENEEIFAKVDWFQ